MGIKKKSHIKKILSYPLIKSKWIKKYKKPISYFEFNKLCLEFDKYLPLIVKKEFKYNSKCTKNISNFAKK